MSWSYGYWPRSKTVAERKDDAAKAIAKAAKKGQTLTPITVAGRKIALTFWGESWCKNLERYQDFAYRLDRGRSYLRSGAVIDLQIAAGRVEAQVVGSRATPYRVAITITAVAAPAWTALQKNCAGSIGSLVDLLAGKLSDAVMTRLCADGTGLFPAPQAIKFTCSCPDYASMCKHVAAAMYGVGARLDQQPELLFRLRGVDPAQLIAKSVGRAATKAARPRAPVIADDALGNIFGIEIDEGTKSAPVRARRPKAKATPSAIAAPPSRAKKAPPTPAPKRRAKPKPAARPA